MLKTGASANAPVFLCPKASNLVCQHDYYALCESDTQFMNQGNAQCVSNKNLS
ncbi:hypothetical protein VAE122_3040234 [Vibrio aestuarianus]|nr:hypothetical protein VAE122_3040234 [Vibrio aestuarianus]